ncbi:MAG: prepilin peptidase [Lentisphaerae bacterium]|jgi:leader peptidase (prepilin peptidase)/N-methyltransferase|nr:prepilin peptidase [Lentisphaerota bacterium]
MKNELALTQILAFFSFWFGACIASFLNVVIWRVPRGESIVSPPSHCPKCNAPIKWWQNLPILSWLALRGKCANCRAPISPRYVLVELLGGALFLAVFMKFNPLGMPLDTHLWAVVAIFVYWIWIALMIAGSFIDFDHQLLPDFTTVGGMVLGLASNAYFCFFHWGKAFWKNFLVYSVGGLALGFGLLWLVRWLGSKAFRREAMGMGDVFLMGAVGALFGPVAVLFTLIVSSILGTVVGVGMILAAKAKFGKFVAIPYGPYICAGCLVWMFWGPQIANWYLSLMRFGG